MNIDGTARQRSACSIKNTASTLARDRPATAGYACARAASCRCGSVGHVDLRELELLEYIAATVRYTSRSVDRLHAKVRIIMAAQDDIDATTARIEADDQRILAANQAVKDELAALVAANPALDLTALTAAVDGLDTAAAGDEANEPAPAS